ncbi:hypothetical protein ACFX19_043774 [Malus domestica]
MADATAALSGSQKDAHMAKTDMAVASVAILVAVQYVEADEAMEAEQEHLVTVVNYAVNTSDRPQTLFLLFSISVCGVNRCTFGNGAVEMEDCVMDDKKRCGDDSELTIINRPR